jgi:ABC-2 type transport system ATP-binding protein
MSARPVIRVDRLSKDYGRRRAVDEISFVVEPGEVFALLGPNAAGKTTTVEILTGHRRSSSGSVAVLGLDPWRDGNLLRQRVGMVLQSAGIDPELTASETVRLYAGFYRAPRPAAELLDLVGLADSGRDRVSTLSGGQRRRLDLALALAGDPELLFLDEPTTGLDPLSRRAAWDLIAGLRGAGTTVLLTSHYMDEVQYLADRIGVMAHGHLVAEATPATLAGRDLAMATISFQEPSSGWEAAVPPDAVDVERRGDLVLLRSATPTALLGRLAGWAVARGEELLGLTVTRPTLEDAFLDLTERRASPR